MSDGLIGTIEKKVCFHQEELQRLNSLKEILGQLQEDDLVLVKSSNLNWALGIYQEDSTKDDSYFKLHNIAFVGSCIFDGSKFMEEVYLSNLKFKYEKLARCFADSFYPEISKIQEIFRGFEVIESELNKKNFSLTDYYALFGGKN